MRELIRFFVENPILAIVLIGMVLQGLGSLAAKSARKAAAERQRGGQGQGQGQAPRPLPPPVARRRSIDADEIAREIRRAMGLDPDAETAPRPPRKPPTGIGGEPDREVHKPPPVPGGLGPRRDREFEFEMQREDEGMRKPPPVPGALPQFSVVEVAPRTAAPRTAPSLPTGPRASAPRRIPVASRPRRARLLNLDNPAAVIVAAEVLGPPLALRDPRAPSFPGSR